MTTDFAAARLNMVESQVRPSDVTDVRIHDAMRNLARETFVPAGKAHLAYADASVEYAPGRALMQPRDVAKLLQVLKPRDGEKVLAIAAPYAAAVLEHMGLSVTQLDGDDLTTVSGGPYDIILTEGSVGEAPASWLAALAVGGRLGLVERQARGDDLDAADGRPLQRHGWRRSRSHQRCNRGRTRGDGRRALAQEES